MLIPRHSSNLEWLFGFSELPDVNLDDIEAASSNPAEQRALLLKKHPLSMEMKVIRKGLGGVKGGGMDEGIDESNLFLIGNCRPLEQDGGGLNLLPYGQSSSSNSGGGAETAANVNQ